MTQFLYSYRCLGVLSICLTLSALVAFWANPSHAVKMTRYATVELVSSSTSMDVTPTSPVSGAGNGMFVQLEDRARNTLHVSVEQDGKLVYQKTTRANARGVNSKNVDKAIYVKLRNQNSGFVNISASYE